MAMKDFSLKQHIVENTLTGNSKGGIYECAIADALYKKGYQIYFYKMRQREKKSMLSSKKTENSFRLKSRAATLRQIH